MILPGDEGTFHQKTAWEPQEQKYTCQREKCKEYGEEDNSRLVNRISEMPKQQV